MLLLKPVAPWLLLLFLVQHLSLSSAARNKSRGGGGRPAARSASGAAAGGRGKFSTGESKMQCTWAAADVAGAVRLTVKCEDPEALARGGVSELTCQYGGKPDLCPAYASDPQGFWKLVTRSFRRMKGDKVCRDERALIKVTTCKRAPRDAHFKLDINTAVASGSSRRETEMPPPPPPPPRFITTTSSSSGGAGPTACTKSQDARKRAEEHCSSSWASLCTFFFSMLQSDEC